MKKVKALISTISPDKGGVPAMCEAIAKYLIDLDIEPVFAWYEPWSLNKDLSVTFKDFIVGKRISFLRRRVFGFEGIGIGCYFPELEFTQYWQTFIWKNLIRECDIHICVGGNNLSALHFSNLNQPFLAWIATSFEADRLDRLKTLDLKRKIIYKLIQRPALKFFEKKILDNEFGNILALSKYTKKELNSISKRNINKVLRMSIDVKNFKSCSKNVKQWTIGFSGRLSDPRKNINLLIDVIHELAKKNNSIELHLIGVSNDKKLLRKIKNLGLEKYVKFFSYMDKKKLASFLQKLDVYVIPSLQEGLCIAGMEAMACGCPVITTRCGGPEEFVFSEFNGYVVSYEVKEICEKIIDICSDRNFRDKLSKNGIKWINENSIFKVNKELFLKEILFTFPQLNFKY